MANLFDYLSWRGDLEFTKIPLNPVDNIIFSQLSYLPMDGIVPGPGDKDRICVCEAMNNLQDKLNSDICDLKSRVMYKDDYALINALGSSKRFGDCHLSGYVNHIDDAMEKQFSAVSVHIGSGLCFVVFRGTDFTLVGWKEDANMSFREAIPAQLEAADYLKKTASITKCPLLVGGHSKGGNLAVYAASNCGKKVQRRITDIYSNDAPGFHEKIINSEGYAEIKSRIRSFVPQGSVIGMIFEQGCDYSVIKSSTVGLLQHNLYSWEVTHNDMLYVDRVTQGSQFVDKTIKEWIGNLDNERREKFFDTLYSIITSSGAKSIPELESNWFKAAGRMLQSMGKIDKSTRHLVRSTLSALFTAAKNNLGTILQPENEQP